MLTNIPALLAVMPPGNQQPRSVLQMQEGQRICSRYGNCISRFTSSHVGGV